MKNTNINRAFNIKKGFGKTWLIMKLSLAMSFLCLFQVSATIYSQNTKVSVSGQSTTVRNVFREIEQQSKFKFLYRKDQFNDEQTITIDQDNTTVENILDEILLNYKNIIYKVLENNLIVLTYQEEGITVTGQVLSASDQEPLPGVNIYIKGQAQSGTITDSEGRYTIVVNTKEDIIVFSFIGMLTEEITVGNQTEINISLVEDIANLDEVIVIGYGTATKKELTGATVSANMDEIKSIPATTVAEALSGQLAGVSVITQSGAPGAETNILVRGGTSITQGTKPLYVVDGFQMEDALDNIDVNDIASIDVMKDASATAIYGARGSNGVVLITTKSAASGKTNVRYNTYFSLEKLGKKLDVLGVKDYVRYQYDLQTLAGTDNHWASLYGGNSEDPDFHSTAYSYIEDEYGSKKGIDWQDQIFGGTNITQNHNLSISTGSEKTNLLVSYNFTGEDGIIAKHGYEKHNIRTKVNHEVSKNIHVDFNTSYSSRTIEGGGDLGGKLKMVILQPTTGGIRFSDDILLNEDISNEMLEIDSQYDIVNPKIEIDAVTNYDYKKIFTTYGGVDIDFLDDFSFRTSGNYYWAQDRRDYWDDGRTKESTIKGGPYGERKNIDYLTWQFTNTLKWNHFFGEHNLNAVIGQEIYQSDKVTINDDKYYQFPESNFGLNDVSMAATSTHNSGKDKSRLFSFFGRLSYNYQSKYILVGTVRADGTSKFAKGNQWGYFPSISAAWRISHESFMENIELINDMKIRIGYGTSGNNNVDSYMYTTDYETNYYAINGAEISTLTPSSIVGNEELKWETITTTNIGLDLALFENRIGLAVDLYKNVSDNLILKNSIPTSTGYQYQFQNIGSIQNKGLEFEIRTRNIQSSNFSWGSNFNLSFNRSKVLNLYNDENDYFIHDYSSRVNFMIKEGEPLGQLYGYEYDGIYTTDDFIQNGDGTYSLRDGVAYSIARSPSDIKPGDMKYKSFVGDTAFDGNPVWTAEDRVVIGNAEPLFTGGFTNTFKYKAFDFSVFINFSYGNEIFNMNSQRFIGPYLPNENTLGVMNDRFTIIDPVTGEETTNLTRLAELNPDQDADDAMWSLHSTNHEAVSAKMSYYVEDGSFIKVKNITLGYTLPKQILSKVNINSLRVYCSATNLLTLTKYSGYDPEVAASSKLLERGVDNSAYPTAKGWVIGLNLNF